MFLLITIVGCSNLHWRMSLILNIILVIPTLFTTVMIFSNVAQSFHNYFQDNHNLSQWFEMAKIGCLLNCCNFNEAVSCVWSSNCIINRFENLRFKYSPMGSFFLFLMWGAIKYSSQMIFLIIFHLFILSSFNCSMIFKKGKLLISQHNFTASAKFLQLLPLFQALF